MKTKKAKSWEMISEGLISAIEIKTLEETKIPIALGLTNKTSTSFTTIQIVPVRSGKYNVVNDGNLVTDKPYKYLSCAVRKAVKEYKNALRSGNWKMLTK